MNSIARHARGMAEGFASVPVAHESGTWRGLLRDVERIEDDSEIQFNPKGTSRRKRMFTLTCWTPRLTDDTGAYVVQEDDPITVDDRSFLVRDLQRFGDGAHTRIILVEA